MYYLIFFVATFAIRWPHEKVNKATTIVKTTFDPKEQLLLLSAFCGGMLLPFLYVFTPVFNFANYPVPIPVGIAGIMISIPCLWLFWRSHVDLGRQWSPKLELRESHRLVTKGVYASVRHPMYSAMFLGCLVQFCLLGNWIVAPSYLIGFGLLYLCRVKREETLMVNEFGDAYVTYMKRTGRLWPRFVR